MADELTEKITECYLQATKHQEHARKAWLPSTRRRHSDTAVQWLALAQSYQLRLSLKRALGNTSDVERETVSRPATNPRVWCETSATRLVEPEKNPAEGGGALMK